MFTIRMKTLLCNREPVQGSKASRETGAAEPDVLFGASREDSAPSDELDEARAKLGKLFGPEREEE